jgi:hypothetical protein
MLLDKEFVAIDRFLRRVLTGLPETVPDTATEQQKAKYKAREKIIRDEVQPHFDARGSSVTEASFQIFAVLDGKASALLTHISVMIAANALLLGTKSSSTLDWLSVGLLFLFVVLALLALRLLRFWADNFPTVGEKFKTGNQLAQEVERSFRKEVFFRTKLYRLTLNFTSVFTFLSAILIIWYGAELATGVDAEQRDCVEQTEKCS